MSHFCHVPNKQSLKEEIGTISLTETILSVPNHLTLLFSPHMSQHVLHALLFTSIHKLNRIVESIRVLKVKRDKALY